ncbi:alpha/beta fold hydrolase [Azohydromonas australica]|uniref:alpha/beta fold hydrolase n=1 Tax=Azohydromonas australica TaxID=364039 RepID=UPI0004041D56|nr:alpha/beta fold hydrolase [Azohydromonas australica]
MVLPRPSPIRRTIAPMRRMTCLLASLLWLAPPARAAEPLALAVLDATGAPRSAVVDGNTVRLQAQLDHPARRATALSFTLDDGRLLGSCTVPRAARACTSSEISTLGWYWEGDDAHPRRGLRAQATTGWRAQGELALAPRPVVFVHGFMSDHHTWEAYTAPGGFLAQAGLQGFAVGDGRAEGVLDTGALARLRSATKTLPENAAALQRYIEGVKRRTGAQQVDLVAHSMGGLVARYYVARLMRERDVAQLLTLGSPHGGSECSGLASALGVLTPAALELRPAFVRQIFNRGVTRRQGVPFHLLAGDPIADGFRAPCSGVPSDSVVSVDSASAIPGSVQRLPVLHTDMTASAEVFQRFVLPLLRRGAGQAEEDARRVPDDAGDAAAQFTQVVGGRVEAGATVEIEVQLDDVAVAGFALFDPSRALEVTVRGASGRVINLTPQEHGLTRVEDPSSLMTLGYGFDRPRPGPWRVSLRAPREGTDYALLARVAGGAVLRSSATPLTPARGQPVQLTAALEHPQRVPEGVAMRAVVHRPDGSTETLEMPGEGAARSVQWRPTQPGLYGIDIAASGRAGVLRIERMGFLAVEVRP